ncbi:carboxylesterase [Cylindrobasidium torrendii FP15055 ss-10]|uniref:Carboxylic ester hydrolase n=1 Tax=Cylindrobasidium torrendii FP15055 ss-10 TaxID=1314674 RepID=A0A0D7B7R3_9AGAR|nr:carboxylesterase [Cylindrobasidium torrendii FP15055 ss-10]
MAILHLSEELANSAERTTVETAYGPVTGGRASNGAVVFLEIPYALPPERFSDPVPLPDGHRYESKEYLFEAGYCFQPTNDGQAGGMKFEDKVGLGAPTENPLFLNIVCPLNPSSSGPLLPVKVYIHGGFLQFGSPHGLKSQNQFVSVERNEIHISIGYRLSVFGFLACDEPHVAGNFGFKDQWLALKWIHANIKAFGGNPQDITVQGLSAGSHSVHQILHHASRLPAGVNAPFTSALLMSNAIVLAPKTPKELRPQFEALCDALDIDPKTATALEELRKIPAKRLCEVIETDAVGTENGTFRGCVDDVWLLSEPEVMAWQRSGNFARALRSKGVRSIIVGDVSEEWYLYSIAHPISSPKDIIPNLERYYPESMVAQMVTHYRTLPPDAGPKESARLFGEILSDFQVHLPCRILARDLRAVGFPVLRYTFLWTPEQTRPEGYVTHATDATIWHLRLPSLEKDQVNIAQEWLARIDQETRWLERGGEERPITQVLALKRDKTIAWVDDEVWHEKMSLLKTLPNE